MPEPQESKKDTVRINLPTGVAGRPGAPVPPGPPTQKLKPETDLKKDTSVIRASSEAKKETAVMAAPAPATKKDTSRVQVAAAKPAPEMPRPTVRLRREEGATSAPPTMAPVPVATAAAPAVAVAAGPSGLEIGLAFVSMLISIAAVAYLASVARG